MKTNYSNLGGYAGNTDGVSFSYNNSKTIEIVDQTLSSHQKQNSKSIGQRTAKFVGFLAFCVLMLQGVAFGQNTANFTAAGTYTWTCPIGVTSIDVEAWGGGGGSGGAGNFANAAAGGGGGGAYAKTTGIAVTPGTTYTITVGARGTAGLNTGTAGGAGGASSFQTTVVVAAGGGGGSGAAAATTSAAGGAGGTAAASTGTVKFSGGNGAAGVAATAGGGGGSSAGTAANGNNGTGATGGTAPTGGIAGGAGSALAAGGVGTAVTAAGGGAGGSRRGSTATARAGALGGPGRVLLTWTTGYCSAFCLSTAAPATSITNFTISGGSAGINNTTTSTVGGHLVFGGTAAALIQGTTSLSYSFTISGGASEAGVAIWIDWNQDNDFADAGETIYNSAAYLNGGTYTGTIPVSASQAVGNYWIRIRTDFNATSPASCGSATRAETEDYPLSVVCPTPVCPTLSSPVNTATSVSQLPTLSWSAGANTSTYDVYLSTTLADVNSQLVGARVSLNQSGTTYTPAAPLSVSTVYYWRVVPKSSCGNFGSSCTTNSFTTQAAVPTVVVSTLPSFGNVCVTNIAGPNSFTVSGINLTGNVDIAALSGYTYCLTAGGTYTTTLSIPPTSGATLASTPVFVKFSPVAATTYNGNIAVSTSGGTDQNVAASGTGIGLPVLNPISGSTTLCIGATSALGGNAASYDITSITTTGVSSFTPTGTGLAEVLVVAGGGAGGTNRGGGGGAGGVVYNSAVPVTAGTPISVTVGAGGVGSATVGNATNGGNSIFGSITATGGGRGGNHATVNNGANGGSGGGAGLSFTTNTFTGGTGIAGQGNAGGGSQSIADATRNTGGGGGAGAAGVTTGTSTATPPNGGVGISNSITGSAVFYGGGGGGANANAFSEVFPTGGTGTGGNGGGGNGAPIGGNPTNGAPNTGGGGGGGGSGTGSTTIGGNGGSGIVIVKSPNFYWSTSNAAVATVDASTGLVTGVSPGTATITYTKIVNGCPSSVNTTVTVNASDAIAAVSSVSGNLCLGASTDISVTQTGSNGNVYSFAWNMTSYTNSGLSGSTSATLNTPITITPTAVGSYVYTINGSSVGCNPSSSVTVNVINPAAGTTATATASPNPICAGSASSLSVAFTKAGTINLGAGGSTSATVAQSFFPGAWGGAKTQYIIRASELTALGLSAGNITSIGFEPTTSGQAYQGFQLWVNSTANTAMTTTFLGLGTQVYLATGANNEFLPVANTVNILTFGTGGTASSFNWDGTSNLVLTFSWSRVPAAATSTASTMKVDAPGFTCSAYEQSDNLTPAAQLAVAVGDGTGTSRPRFIIAGNVPPTTTALSWSNGATVVGTTNPLSQSPVVSTNYTATATIGGCPLVSNAAALTVIALPSAPTPNVASSVQCGAGIPTVSVSGTAGEMRWYNGNTVGATLLQTGGLTYTSTITSTQTLYVGANNGTCETAAANRTPLTITVNTADALTATISPLGNICLGASIGLSAAQTGSTQNYTLTWTASPAVGSGIPSSIAGSLSSAATITPTAAGTYIYTISGVDGICSNIGTVSVTVINPNAGATVTASANPSPVCAGSSTSLNLLVANSGVSNLGAGATPSATVAQSFFPGGWGGAKTQYIIRASELTALGFVAGNITSIGFEPTTAGQAYQGFQLWVNSTTNSAMTTTFLGLGTQVYLATGANNEFLPVANTVNTLTFGTGGTASSFNWDGTSNLVLTFSWSRFPLAATSTASTMKVDAPGFTCSAYEQSDNLTAAAQLAMAVGDGTGTSRPRFIITGNKVLTPTSYSWTTGATVVGTTNPLSVSPSVTTAYTGNAVVNGCPVSSSPVSVSITPLPSAPIATNSTQCGPAIPAAYMSTGNAQSAPIYNWYSAASGGTPLNTMTTYYNNDFSSSLTANGVTGTVAATGTPATLPIITGGALQITPNLTSQIGGFTVPGTGVDVDAFQFSFNMLTTAGGADGFSLNFGDDVPTSIGSAEQGAGTKLSICFSIYATPGITVKYGGTSTNLGFSAGAPWAGTNALMNVDINSAGQVTVSVNGTPVLSNIQLPPAYLSANKSAWSFNYLARTGGISSIHNIDNVLIKYLPIPNSTYPTSISSTTTFYVSETVGTCESPRTPLTITVLSNTPPAAPTVTSTPTINVGGTSTFTATGVAGGTISWYSSALGGAVLGTGTTFTSPTQCTPNTNITYYAADDDGTCVSSTRGSSITAVRPLITTDPANALICTTGGNVVLSGNVSGGSSIAWSPGTSLTTTTSLVTTATPTTTTQYAFSANVAGCAAQSGTVNVGVIAGASFTPTATPASLCEGGTSVLASNLASAGFTVSTITNAPSTAPGSAVTLANGTATPVVPLTSGSNDDGGWGAIPLGFTYNFFGANYTTVNVSTNGLIQFGAYNANGGFTAPYGLADYTYTNAFPTTLEPMNIVAGGACDLTITNGTVRYWTEGLAPTRVFVISYNVNGLGSGNNTFQIKLFETTGVVEVHVTSNTAQTGSNKAIGVNNFDGTIGNTAYNNAANLTNTAYRFVPGAAYTFQWSVGGSVVSGATSTSYTTPTLNTPGSVVYTCAATNPLTQCASTQPVTITVNPKPTAPISGGNVTACSNITPQTLSVSAPAGCTIDWYSAATGGTVLAGGVGTATFSATTAGTYYAEARNTTTGCTSPTRTAVVYTQNPAPAAPTVTTPIAFCENSIATVLTATGTGSNTLNWYTVPTGGTASSTAPTPLTTTATTLNYYVTQVDANNSCESNRALIEVQIDATPAAPVTSAAGPYCENATATALSATATGANTLNWYTVATGGTASGTAITPTTTPAGTTLYYVSQTAAYTLPTLTCESARASISVLVNPNITASVDNSATTTSLCTGGNIDFTATPTNGGATPSYQWQVNGANVGTNSPTYTLTPQLFSDNGGNSAYSSSWSNSSNGGTGFGAWNISAGANTGTFIGDPAADGNSNAGIGVNSFGMYATGSAYLNALRTINGGMQVGDTLSFYWIFNWDANGGAKGFSLRNGGTEVFFVNNSGASATITSTAGTVNTAYGTTPMLVKLVRTSATQYAFSMTSRSGGATYTTTITNSTSIDGINFYIGNQNQASGNRNMYVNNLVMKKYYEVLVNMTPSAQTCLTSGSATPSNTIVLGYAPSTPAVSIVAGASTTICPGTSLSFSIASSANLGSTPTYQWQVNGVDVVGQTSATFTSTTLVNSDVVSLIASSSISGGCLTSTTATSNTVSVTVQAPTTFTTQPADAAACLGATQVFTAAATGTGTISYQWFKSNVSITGNPTAITNSLTLAGLVAGSAADYYVRATGTCGSRNSDTITLTLNPNTAITTQPIAVSQCAGTNALFTVAATGFGTLTYQWRKNGTAISGQTNDTLILTNIQAADAATYSVLVTGGCNSLASSGVALTVNPLVNFVTQPAATPTVCAGTTSNLSASVTGAGTLSYQWQLNGVNVPFATSSSLAISNTQAANAGVYTLIATSSLCGADTSSVSTLTVNPVTAISTQPIDLTLCNGSDALFNVVTAGIGTINYQWRYNGTNIPGETNDTLIVNNITNTTNGGTYNVVVTGGTCSSGTINSTTVSLNIQSPTNAVSGSQSATCVVRGGDWIHFYTNDGKLLVSIKGTTPTADFGSVTATSYVLADAQITTSCADPVNEYYKTAVLGRSWYINPTNNLPATVRLPLSNTEVSALIAKSAVTTFNENDNVFSLADINLSKYNGLNENGSWQDNCNPADSTSYATSNLYIPQSASGALSTTNGFIETIAGTSYVEFSVPGFSEFWLMNSEFATPLPVKLTSFAASCEENEVAVKWTTATEQNSQNFIVERSRDLAIWEFVSNVEAAGNSSTSLDYAVSDLDPISGVSYYRLKQVDLNGAEKIYGPISVSCSEKENEMIVFPNPTKGNFTVEISSNENYSDAQIQITDLTGKVINARSTNILEGKNQFTFEGLDLQLGTYIINLNTGNGKINPVRVVVN